MLSLRAAVVLSARRSGTVKWAFSYREMSGTELLRKSRTVLDALGRRAPPSQMPIIIAAWTGWTGWTELSFFRKGKSIE
jgi:hypothetical protein